MVLLLLTILFFSVHGSTDKNAGVPNFNLVNQSSLDKILNAEVFVHMDGQLRAAHIILGYTPISKTFQASKCIIKARDPRLHRISVATLGFLIFGPIVEGVLTTDPILEGIPKVEASSSCPIVKENEEEEEEEEEEIVEVSNFKDDFEVFNQLESPIEESQYEMPPSFQTSWEYKESQGSAFWT